MSTRKQAKALGRWENVTRRWAIETGRDLALDLYHNKDRAARSYEVGVVLDPGEKVWVEVPARFNLDWPQGGRAGEPSLPAFRPWLVTSRRVVGRLADDRLHGYRWEQAVGVRIDLTAGNETVIIDVEGEPTLVWFGAGVAPLAAAAVFHLHGAVAMIEHPGLAALRGTFNCPEGQNSGHT